MAAFQKFRKFLMMNLASERFDEAGKPLRRLRLHPEVADSFLTHYLNAEVLPNHLPICRYALTSRFCQRLLARKLEKLRLEHFNFDTFAFHLTKISAPTIWISVNKTLALLRLLNLKNTVYETSADGSLALTKALISVLKGTVRALTLKNAYISNMWESTNNSLLFLREFAGTMERLQCDPRFLGFEMVPKLRLDLFKPKVSDADLMEMEMRVPDENRSGFETEILRCTLRHNITTLDLDADSKPFFTVDPRNPPIAPNHDLLNLKFHCATGQTYRAFDFFRRFKCVAPNLARLEVEFAVKREFSADISQKSAAFWQQLMSFVDESRASMEGLVISATLCFVDDTDFEVGWISKFKRMVDQQVEVRRNENVRLDHSLIFADHFAHVELRVLENQQNVMLPVEAEVQTEKDGFVY
ncbi:unnamed protein product [Bursaphelenchus xylophilus]|uniref:(pine wood nematode) hypothetical protein n=1 Tax=Bursaphelenchus xylophilus TaxID=6326 RepID=A0A1I7RX21_BURXY|nr:unnamed protein product [Bursaphelenchus xylophilus]CAG9121274.1 unnamed protein product [Bursaphelenchus xylophilus]